MIPSHVLTSVVSAPWFRAPWAPYAVLDRDLRVRGVNRAFERATAHHGERVVGQVAIEVFPDNPHDPAADGAAQVSASVERVLRTGVQDWMRLQRYDLPDPHRPGAFVYRMWLPVNSPITEHGRVVGVLHHAQDVTSSFGPPRPITGSDHHELDRMAAAVEELQQEFPTLHPGTVLGVLTDSQRVVLDTLRTLDARKAVELARLRLEVHTGAPAVIPSTG